MKNKPATISDVARDSGVSIATVSYVMNNGPRRVDDDTKARVLASMQRLSYHPNTIARALTSKRLNAIGVVFPHPYPRVFTDSYFVSIMDGIVDAAAKRRQNVMLYTGLDWYGHDSLPAFRDRRVDGLLLIAMLTDSGIVPSLIDAGIQFVQINGMPVGGGASNVDIDNADALRQVIAHFVALGHRKIAYLGGQLNSPSSLPRRGGFIEALREHGLEARPEMILDGAYDRDWGRDGMSRLLALPDRPTAVFAGGDGIAHGIYDVCAERGLNIPADLSIIGFDDTPYASQLHPSLTSVRQPLVQMGSAAASILLDQLAKKGVDADDSKQDIVLPAELIVRESTARVLEPVGTYSK